MKPQQFAINPIDLYAMPPGLYIVRRPKLSGLGYHYGVCLPDRSIVDYNSDSIVRQGDPFQFACNHLIEVVRQVPDSEAFNAHLRLQRASFFPSEYDLLHWNCETFATWLAGEEPRSDQVRWAILAAAAVAIVAIARNS